MTGAAERETTAATVLVNASTLIKGGGIQVAASFIAETVRNPSRIVWHYALSPQVADELKSLAVELERAEIFASSPSRDRSQRKRLAELERRIAPDAVFTVFGPAYVKFAAPHLCGVAVCWLTHSTLLAYRSLPSMSARLRNIATCIYQGIWMRHANAWVVEADNARNGMKRRLNIPLERIAVVPNTCAAVFKEAGMPPAPLPQPGQKVRLLYVTAYYPHKNLECIPDVAAALREIDPGRDYEFVITIPEHVPELAQIMQRAEALGVRDMITSVGRVSLNQVIELYGDSDISFMPSLLETFSASYPEAMAMGRPIVASDLDFARAVCGDAANYYKADDYRAAADTIARLSNNADQWQDSIAKGKAVLAQLPDAQGKYEQFLDHILELIRSQRH